MSKKPAPPPDFRKPPSRRFIEWALLIEAARHAPNTWFLAFPAGSPATVHAIRQRARPELRLDDGVLEAEGRNPYIHDGRSWCDVFVRFTPKEN